MSNLVFLRIMYRNTANLHAVTSVLESINGLRIKHLSFVNRGRDFIGVVAFEAPIHEDVANLIRLLSLNRDISSVEKVPRVFRY